MICRLVRIVIVGFWLLSLLVCIGTAWLWRRSYRVHDRVDRRRAHARYTVHSTGGRLYLSGPPPGPPPGATDQTVRRVVAVMSNRDLQWFDAYFENPLNRGQRMRGVAGPVPHRGTPTTDAVALWGRGAGPKPYARRAPAVRALLNALEDPDKALAAHAVLYGPVAWDVPTDQLEFTRALDGLPVVFRLVPVPGDVPVSADVPDPTAWAALRTRWHDRLDVRIGSIPDSFLLFATAGPPLLWSCAWARRTRRRRRRVRLGLCLACGYDLRESPQKCPECGAVAGGTPGREEVPQVARGPTI